MPYYMNIMRLKKIFSGLAIATVLLMAPGAAFAAGCPADYVQIGVPIISLNGSSGGILNTKDSKGKAIQCVSNKGDGAIIAYVKALLQYLSGLVGLVIILMIIVSGIQYLTAYGNPKSITAAKNRLTNAIIGLFLFIFAFALLSFLIPGGIIG